METTIFYSGAIFLATLLSYICERMMNSINYSKRFGKILAFMMYLTSFFIAFFVSAVRYFVGTDYHLYIHLFNITDKGLSLEQLMAKMDVEPGWIMLNIFLKNIFSDPQSIIVCSSLIFVGCIYISIYMFRKDISISLAVFIFMCTIYFTSFNLVRQCTAIAILCLALKSIEKKCFWKFCIIVLLATSIHYTAIIFVVVYLYINNINKLNKTKRYLLIIGMGFVLVFYNQIINIIVSISPFFEKYSRYSAENSISINIKDLIFKMPIIISIIYFDNKIKKDNKFMGDFINIYFIFIFLGFLSSVNPFAARVAFYFEVTQIFFLPYIVKNLKFKSDKIIFCLLIFMYFYYSFYINYMYYGYHEIKPYMNIMGWIF